MSVASDHLLSSLRAAVGRATLDIVDRTLVLDFDEMGFGGTFESPIEHFLFLALCVETIRNGRAVRFTPGLGRSPGEWALRMEEPRGAVMSTYVPSLGPPIVRDELNASDGIFIGPAGGIGRVTRIMSQVQYRTYRLDFLVVDSHGTRVAIECDGHDYHERTKDQARRDRKRDRSLTKDGLACLRFTGSELFSDAIGCAREVYDFLDEQMFRDMGGA